MPKQFWQIHKSIHLGSSTNQQFNWSTNYFNQPFHQPWTNQPTVTLPTAWDVVDGGMADLNLPASVRMAVVQVFFGHTGICWDVA